MIKKQTVWILTMLSLLVVLSTYFMMADKNDFTLLQENDSMLEDTLPIGVTNENNFTVDDLKQLENSELFTTIRMQLEDERNLKRDRYKDIIASSSATTTEINNALNSIDALETVMTKEKILQDTILKIHEDFKDVLVRAEEDIVHVQIVTAELDSSDAVKIMQMVKDELGEKEVDIDFQTN